MENLITVKPKMLKGQVVLHPQKEIEAFELGAYFLVSGAIGNDIVCKGLDVKKDKKAVKIIDIIKMAGGEVKKTSKEISAKMTGMMKGIEVDVENDEEILPLVAVLCAFLKGESYIRGVKNTQSKLVRGIASEFNHLGIPTKIISQGICISGVQTILNDGAYAWEESSLAIALMLAASRAEGDVRVFGFDINDAKLEAFVKLYNELSGGKEI